MRVPAWHIEDEPEDPTGTPRPLLITGRSILDAVKRSTAMWLTAGFVGGLLGLGVFLALPDTDSATASILMVHPDPGDMTAMTTDVTLLETRAVASRALADLDLAQTPESFLSSVSVTPVNNQILELTVDGPSGADAVTRAQAVIDTYLDFRAEQLRSISDGLVEGYQKRIDDLQTQVDALTREYDSLATGSTIEDARASEILTTRTQLGSQITQFQRSIEEASLQTEAAITSTHVIDAPAAVPHGSRRTMVLAAGSGAMLGAGLVLGIILLRTLTLDVARHRSEVAAAMGVPVRVGVGPVPSRRALARTAASARAEIAARLRDRPRRWTARVQARPLELLVQGLEAALPVQVVAPVSAAPRTTSRRGGATTLGVVAIDRTAAAALVLATLARRLVDRGVSVLLVDLSAGGLLAPLVEGADDERDGDEPDLWLFRPEGDPALATGPRRGGRTSTPRKDSLGRLGTMWEGAEVALVLLEIDPGTDLDILRTWVNRVVPLVSAGRASAELLTTVAELVRGAGIDLPFALLEGCESSDRTLGRPAFAGQTKAEAEAARVP